MTEAETAQDDMRKAGKYSKIVNFAVARCGKQNRTEFSIIWIRK